MASFTDTRDDEWRLSVSYHDVQCIKRDHGFYLPALFDDNLANLAKVYGDIALLVCIVAALCSEQMTSRGIEPEDFAKRLGGDVLKDAADAVVEATIDFFPEPHRREAMRTAWAKMLRADDAMRAAMNKNAISKLDEVLMELSG